LPEANTSLWSVKDAQRLMLDGAQDPARQARLQYVNPQKPVEVLMIGKTPFRLLPEATPGRALLWGTILCVFAGSASAKLVLKALGVEKISDLKTTVSPMVANIADKINSRLEPVKEWRAQNSTSNAADSVFGRKLKSVMQ